MDSVSSQKSIFTMIVHREIPADIVWENERIIAFSDIAPKAPVHLIIVPKTPIYSNVTQLAAGDPALLAEIVSVAQQLADERTGGHYRLVFNTGEAAGQTVFHVHAHVMGGHLTEGSLGFE